MGDVARSARGAVSDGAGVGAVGAVASVSCPAEEVWLTSCSKVLAVASVVPMLSELDEVKASGDRLDGPEDSESERDVE
jgi:hypothetical protein